MSDVMTLASTRMMRSDAPTTLPVGTRLRCVSIDGASVLQDYVGEIGTVVSHSAYHAPLVEFETRRSNDDKWYVVGWNVLPMPGQRVTVAECLSAAQEDFKNFATGREVTYLSTDERGVHLVRFDQVPSGDYVNPASAQTLEFTLGAEVSNTNLTSSEPVLIVDTAESIEQRDRDARVKYEALVEAINDLAEREEWCGNFEEWAEENGVEVRRSQDVEYIVDFDLEYEISTDDIGRILAREYGGDHDNIESSVNVTSCVSINITCTGGESPHDVDGYNIRQALEDAGYTGFDDWSISDYTEA